MPNIHFLENLKQTVIIGTVEICDSESIQMKFFCQGISSGSPSWGGEVTGVEFAFWTQFFFIHEGTVELWVMMAKI